VTWTFVVHIDRLVLIILLKVISRSFQVIERRALSDLLIPSVVISHNVVLMLSIGYIHPWTG
jgi:hypothetical protein